MKNDDPRKAETNPWNKTSTNTGSEAGDDSEMHSAFFDFLHVYVDANPKLDLQRAGRLGFADH